MKTRKIIGLLLLGAVLLAAGFVAYLYATYCTGGHNPIC